jgi:hypothetical protein
MRPITFFIAISLFVFFSCKKKTQQIHSPQKQEVPKPLQDDNKDFSMLRKSGGREDLVQAIYIDLVKKHADLKKLEDQMEHFNDGCSDSLETFKNYDSKSNSYYTSAFETLNDIKDTVLKQRLRILLTGSRKNYEIKTARFTSLMKKIELNQLATKDYYLTLKLAATLPVIEDYQADNLSEGKSIMSLADESEKLNQHTQKLALKYQNKVNEKK